MKKYDIYIANYAKTKALKFPILPSNLPTISRGVQNETFETYWNGSFNFIEKAGLTSFSLEGWLPDQDYSFARSKTLAPEFIALFNYAIDNVEPVQVLIICSDGSTFLNDLFSIESFDHSIRKNGDYNYSISFKQWRDYNV